MKPFVYNATVTRVVDGDTVDVDLDLGFGIWFRNQRIRLMGVDTPEKRTSDPIEKQFGLLASRVVESMCPVGKKILVETSLDDKGKFGRILGTLIADDVNINRFLIENHYAVEYVGQSKENIQDAHNINYTWLQENGKIVLE
jgi:micrococcal nuclease